MIKSPIILAKGYPLSGDRGKKMLVNGKKKRPQTNKILHQRIIKMKSTILI
jgi:hypothetical protein